MALGFVSRFIYVDSEAAQAEVGDSARILVKPYRDKVARVRDVWPQQQLARLEVDEEIRR